MDKKFIVRSKHYDTKSDESITLTIRIEKTLQEQYDELAFKSNCSRNEPIGMTLKFAINNYEFVED